jgi:hypothetical protein
LVLSESSRIFKEKTKDDKMFQSQFLQRSKLAFLILVLYLVSSAGAVDYELSGMDPVHTQIYGVPDAPTGYYFPMPEEPNADLPRFAAGALTGLVFLITGYLMGAARSFLGPLMGITSVLWFMMRNDPAVKPEISWIVFGAWSMLTLAYLAIQCTRVLLHKLYILLTLTFAAVCLCVLALVQKSSIPGGLVTAIPPCTSFAAYAVAFCFPDRRHRFRDSEV